MVVGETGRIHAGGPRRVHQNGPSRHRIVGGSGGDHTLGHQDLLGFRLDPQALDLFQAHRSHFHAGQHQGVLLGGLHYRRHPLVEGTPASMPHFRLLKDSIRDHPHPALNGNRGAVAAIGLGSDLQLHRVANPGFHTAGHRLGIEKDHHGIGGFLGQDFGQHDGGVSRTSATNVVADIQQHHRGLGGPHGHGHRLGGIGQVGLEFLPPVPGPLGHPARCLAGQILVSIGHRQEAGAEFLHVRVGKPHGHAGG